MRSETDFRPTGRVPIAVVLGTNDVASAVGRALFLAGYGVVLSRDPAQPVLRRTMAYDVALDTGIAELDGVKARAADSLVDILNACTDRQAICVTIMELGELLCLGLIDVLVDARMRMRSLKVDIRPFARATVGLGPGFSAGRHVDVAIETAPEAIGVLRAGATLAAHGRSTPLSGAGRERFARAEGAGLWLTAHAIGDQVAAAEVVGWCGEAPVQAPMAGHLRGLVRGGTQVPEGLKLLEVDPAVGGPSSWLGLAERPRRIADAVLEALDTLGTLSTAAAGPVPH
ncbi:hypothetical protein [Aquabacter cavernae]|uniref:hypothetical protein n=1 Tax=Aquabacter cavernae TaxID=2496029 RepID=UPI000F8E05E0|nr:hypothetical protein [Aquabacter cavernae]